MKAEDFAIFVLVPFLMVPLVAAYLSLRIQGWYKDRLFTDAWIIFLAILAAGLASLVLLVIVTNKLGVYWGISEFLWVILNFLFTLGISCVFVGLYLEMIIRSRLESNINIFEGQFNTRSPKPKVARIAFVTVMLSTALPMGSIIGSALVFDYCYPKPKIEYGIYDI